MTVRDQNDPMGRVIEEGGPALVVGLGRSGLETANLLARQGCRVEVSELTDGAFDVTVGPLVDAWGFGPGARPEKPPADSVLEGVQVARVHVVQGYTVRVVPVEILAASGDIMAVRGDLSPADVLVLGSDSLLMRVANGVHVSPRGEIR